MPINPLNRLSFANLAANGAEQLAMAAIPLMAALTLGATAETMGALSAVQTLPFLLFSLVAGIWADRMPRHLLMAGSEAGRALLLVLVPVLAFAGWLDLVSLGLLGFALSACTVMFNVAAQAYLPAIVAREGLPAANAKIEFTRAAAVFLGPGIAGAIAGWTSPAWALAVSAVTSAMAVLLMLSPGMRRDLPVTARPPIRRALAEGLVVVWRHPLLRAIAGCAMAWNFSWFVLMAVFVLFAVNTLGLTPAQVGIALGAQGLGMLLAALAAPTIHARLRLGIMIILGPATSLFAALAIGASTMLRDDAAFAMLLTGFFLFGFGPMLWTIGQTSLRQAIVPLRLIGRVSAIQQVATLGMRPLGALVGGVVGERFGLEAAIWLAVAGYGVQLAVILLSQMPALTALPPAMEEEGVAA
ncbi:MFS transporter [Ferrovibrio terrae]|uniref:MFS transporter n=1 Tax=Ferrovibrio terrae TaxID=2594003 RepID=A0A516H5I0_9PROT|nr:MFS transporter [Ferrovibrio terrae]QDO98975.1 MFS transporter [Ferrovibrio terrae]